MRSLFLGFSFIFIPFVWSQTAQDYRKIIEQALSQQQSISQSLFDVRVERVNGGVDIISMEEEKASLKDNYQYPLESGDIVKTSYDGEANIYVNNFAILNIPRNTELEITETQGEVVFSLVYGATVGRLEKNAKTGLKIKTPSATSLIKSTQFAIEHIKLSGESVFAVIDDGELEVYPLSEENNSNSYKLLKNQEIIINPSSKRFKVSNISRLLKYKSKILAAKKRLTSHKAKWKMFTTQERVKYRQKLFSNATQNSSKKKSLKNRNR